MLAKCAACWYLYTVLKAICPNSLGNEFTPLQTFAKFPWLTSDNIYSTWICISLTKLPNSNLWVTQKVLSFKSALEFFFCKSRVLNFTPGNSAGVKVHKSIMILPFYGILSKRCCSCEEEYEQYDVYRCYLSCYLPCPVSRIAPKTVMRAPITCVVQANIAEVLLL